jgi:hypothetical protein
LLFQVAIGDICCDLSKRNNNLNVQKAPRLPFKLFAPRACKQPVRTEVFAIVASSADLIMPHAVAVSEFFKKGQMSATVGCSPAFAVACVDATALAAAPLRTWTKRLRAAEVGVDIGAAATSAARSINAAV